MYTYIYTYIYICIYIYIYIYIYLCSITFVHERVLDYHNIAGKSKIIT